MESVKKDARRITLATIATHVRLVIMAVLVKNHVTRNVTESVTGCTVHANNARLLQTTELVLKPKKTNQI